VSARAASAAPDDHPIARDGVWCEAPVAARGGGPALFLDRDGVVVEEVGYLGRVEDVALIPGAAAVIAAANARRIPVVLVSNQAGIGRGYFGWREFAAVQATIVRALATAGARIDAVYACPHHPRGTNGYAHPDHPARKPNPGMILRAATDLAIALDRSWLVGDKAIDVEAARRAGLAGALHVLTGHGPGERAGATALAAPGFDLRLGRSITDALALPVLAAARAA
jgi:D-glycero-D-manno-heptose 1,7-bisphosphate phosphatase